MLLNYINKAFIIIGLIIFTLFIPSNSVDNSFTTIHFVSFVVFILFSITIYQSSKRKSSFYNSSNLAVIVFFVSVLNVLIFQLLSYYIDGDTFVFSKADAMLYHSVSLNISKMGVTDAFYYLTNILDYGVDDWGSFLWISSMYRIAPYQQFLSFSYIILGCASSLMLFDLGRNYMPKKYAFLSALTFSLSSFTTLFYSICLKETIMIFFIIASFNNFAKYERFRKLKYLLFSLGFTLSLLLFRTPTALLLFLSFSLTLVLIHLKGTQALILSIILTLIICSTPLFSYTYQRYLRGGDTEAIIERKNELAGGGGIVNQLADPVAALMGPFPSIKINSIKPTPLYAPGLIFRFLLSIPFYIGAIYIFLDRKIKMYPLVIFFISNAIGVAVSVKGLETRLSIPHLSMPYIVAFWFLAKNDFNQLKWNIKERWVYLYIIGIFGLCLLWNIR